MKTVTRRPSLIKEIEFHENTVASILGDFSDEIMKEQLSTIMGVGEEGMGVLPVVIDSFGGDAYAMTGIIDLWEQTDNLIVTSAISKACSAGAILLAFGTPGMRFISPRCTYMLHDISSGLGGKLEEIKATAQSIDNMREEIFVEMARVCGQPDNFLFDLLGSSRNADVYLTPQQVVDYGIADHIGIPTIVQEIVYEYSILDPRGNTIFSNVRDHKGSHPVSLASSHARNNPPHFQYPARDIESEEEFEMKNMLSTLTERQLQSLVSLASNEIVARVETEETETEEVEEEVENCDCDDCDCEDCEEEDCDCDCC